MTRVEVAVPRTAPADGSGNGSNRLETGGGFDEADAGFSQQLASVAADEDGSGNACIPRSTDSGEGVVVRWWRQQACIDASQPAVGPVQGGEQAAQATSALLAGNDTDAPMVSLPAADLPSGDEREPQGGDAPEAKPADPAVRIAAVLASAPTMMPVTVAVAAVAPQTPPQAPIDPQLPVQTKPLPANAKARPAETMQPTVDVKVVGAETHLAPALRVLSTVPPASKPAFVESGGAAENRKPDQPADSSKPVRLNAATQRGQSPEQSLAQGASDQFDADMPEPGSNSDNFTQVAPLAARGPTHATQPTTSPVQQIADKIAAELAPAGRDGARAAPATTSRLAPLQPVRVLTIQLHPADLGTVTVRMTLKADAMDVQVETGRRATARLIDADRDTLAGLLRSAGYHVEALTVRAVEQPSMASSPGPSQGAPDSGAQLPPGGSQPDARASGGRPQPEPRGYAQVPDRNSNDSEQASGERRGTGVYV